MGASTFSGRCLLVLLRLAICLFEKLFFFSFFYKLQVQIRKQKASNDLECDGIWTVLQNHFMHQQANISDCLTLRPDHV